MLRKRSNSRSVAVRVDRGDAEHVTDRRVGRRAAALAEDLPASRELDDRVHSQEVRRVAKLLDQSQLVTKSALYLVRHVLGITRLGPLPGQAFEGLLRRKARDRRLFGILVGPAPRVRSGRDRRSPMSWPALPDSTQTDGASRHPTSGAGRRRAPRLNPTSSIVQPLRMQVTTSCKTRRRGWWNSTSFVTTVRTFAWAARLASLCSRSWSRGLRRKLRARWARSPKISAIRRSCAAPGGIRQVGCQYADHALGVQRDVLPAENALGLATPALAQR